MPSARILIRAARLIPENRKRTSGRRATFYVRAECAAMAAEFGNELSQRDRETLRRLFSRCSKTVALEIFHKEYALWSAGRQLLVDAPKKGGRSRATKRRQALLVALCWLRDYHKRNRSVAEVAANIFETIEIRSKHSTKGPDKPYASSAVLEEHLREGLRIQDVKVIGQCIWYLFWWRKNAVNHDWGFQCGDNSLAFGLKPKNTKTLIKWIDAGLASNEFRQIAVDFDTPGSPVRPAVQPAA
jgi:hypothetical protein